MPEQIDDLERKIQYMQEMRMIKKLEHKSGAVENHIKKLLEKKLAKLKHNHENN